MRRRVTSGPGSHGGERPRQRDRTLDYRGKTQGCPRKSRAEAGVVMAVGPPCLKDDTPSDGGRHGLVLGVTDDAGTPVAAQDGSPIIFY